MFAFVMRMEALAFPEAVRTLAQELGIELPEEKRGPQAQAEITRREGLFDINARTARFYTRCLHQAPDALEYLQKERGLSKKTIEDFSLGFAPAGWSTLVDQLASQKLPPEAPLDLGLIGRSDKGRLYDRLRGRLVFPIEIDGGHIAGFGARRADWIDPEGPKYLNSPESPVYQKSRVLYGLHGAKHQIRRARQAILVEGYLDVIALAEAGIGRAVAACGTSLTSEHATLLARHAKEVATFYDGDDAGLEASQRSAVLLLQAGLSVKVVPAPAGEDPDTLVRQHGGAAIEDLIAKAPSAIDFFLTKAQKAHSGAGIAGMTHAIESVKPLIRSIDDPLERDVAIAGTARRLNIEEYILRRHLGARRKPRAGARSETKTTQKPSIPVVETTILKLFLESPEAVGATLEKRQATRAFRHPGIQAAVTAGLEAQNHDEKFDPPRALEVMLASSAVSERDMAEARKVLLESLPERHNLDECVTRLLRADKEHRLRDLRRRLETETDPKTAAKLAQEASEVMASTII